MSPAFFPSLQRALDAAASAGELAGAAYAGVMDKLAPPPVDDETVFDEQAAEKYLASGANDVNGVKIEVRNGYPYRVADTGPYTWAEITQLVEDLIDERLTTPADDEASATVRGPAAGASPAAGAHRLSAAAGLNTLDAQQASDAAFGLKEWRRGHSCYEPQKWQHIIDALETYARTQ